MITSNKKGFSLVEVILSSAIFTLLVMAIVGSIIYGRESTGIAGAKSRAIAFAEEGIEVVKNIRDENFSNLVDGTYGLVISSGQWALSGSSDSDGVFTRRIEIGTVSEDIKNITSTVTWQESAGRPGQVSLSFRATNWRAPKPRGGVLVYGDGGTAQDLIRYKVLDSTGSWNAPALAADIDPATTNKGLRAVQIYSSATRNEKVMISRHLAGTNSQSIYAQIYDGSTWSNVLQLSSWTSNAFVDVQNFSGTYLENGDFMVVYSDNTTSPKARVWNGSSWLGQVSLPNISEIPAFIVLKSRPGTNEAMAVFFDQQRDTNTLYFNGAAYAPANWTSLAEHATNAPFNNHKLVDFAWSLSNPTKGALIFSSSNADRNINAKIWTANGLGGGSWSANQDSATIGNNISSLTISPRANVSEFSACKKDSSASPRIYCFRLGDANSWSSPANQVITISSDTGIQISFGLSYETAGGGLALNIYSDTTNVPKLKKYTPTSNSWDAGETNLNTLGGALETVRIVPHPSTDDLMILFGDTNQDLYSLIWNGSNDSVYTLPVGKAFNSHGTNGSFDEGYWFDFAWDRY